MEPLPRLPCTVPMCKRYGENLLQWAALTRRRLRRIEERRTDVSATEPFLPQGKVNFMQAYCTCTPHYVSQNGMTDSDSRTWVMLRIGRPAVQSHKRKESVYGEI